MGKRLFLVLAASALALMQAGTCMSAPVAEQQDMQCCHSKPCTPVNHGKDCGKIVSVGQASSVLPAQLVSLHGPAIASVEYPRTTEIPGPNSLPPAAVNAQQHSPPELYTLHVSFLI